MEYSYDGPKSLTTGDRQPRGDEMALVVPMAKARAASLDAVVTGTIGRR